VPNRREAEGRGNSSATSANFITKAQRLRSFETREGGPAEGQREPGPPLFDAGPSLFSKSPSARLAEPILGF